MSRQDCLKECNDKSVPIEDFRLAFCSRCLQPGCTRSQYGQSKFDQRVATWVERLFEKVPRMESVDPRYQTISGQGFLSIESIEPGGGSSWLDPKDIPPERVSVDFSSVGKSSEGVENPEPEKPKEELKEIPTRIPQEIPTRIPQEVLLMNTKKQAIYLPGEPKQRKKVDPWATPEPIKPGEKLVGAGATIRFGSNK